MSGINPDSAETNSLLQQAEAGDEPAFDRLFERHRSALLEFIELRLDRRLRARLDASDVIQEAQLEALRRFRDFLNRRPMPFRLWLRKTAYEQLVRLHRQHAEAEKRTVLREMPLPERSSLALARQVLTGSSTPSQQLAARELARRVQKALSQLSEMNREILIMRNFDGLSYSEAACILDITPDAAKKRHGRALLRLHRLLLEGGLTESQL